jgi:putative addiction module killer protein
LAVITLLRSSEFDAWLSKLADQRAKARILARLTGAVLGNFGDCEPVGEGVSEMRIHVGPPIVFTSCATGRPSTCC